MAIVMVVVQKSYLQSKRGRRMRIRRRRRRRRGKAKVDVVDGTTISTIYCPKERIPKKMVKRKRRMKTWTKVS